MSPSDILILLLKFESAVERAWIYDTISNYEEINFKKSKALFDEVDVLRKQLIKELTNAKYD